MIRFVFIYLGLLLLNSGHAASISVTDDAGQHVELKQPAQRIVSLAPHITELLFSIGVGDRIVGTVDYSDYPEAAQKIPRVGGNNALDLERIVSLSPDLVIAWGTGNKPVDLEKLRRFNLPVFISEPRRLTDIPDSLVRLSELTGTEEQAKSVIEQFNNHLDGLRRYSGREPVSVFYQIWDRPLMTVNGQHLIGDVIRLCGGRNIFADAPALTPRVGVEAVIERAPQVIIVGGVQEQHQNWLQSWEKWQQIPAVQHGQLYLINPDQLQRHSLRILQGAETLCHLLQQARESTD
ncbi:MAG: cobalamin-binding protein [Thiohalophilus sp.]